ncbi:unnamed protein product [Mesocestoides corti]|nr:unnamed protein product [Mesocestoides corti]
MVEDLKTVNSNSEVGSSFVMEAFTQMQTRHEDFLRQLQEAQQASVTILFKMVTEEDQRLQRLREELGLCGDLEKRWRKAVEQCSLKNLEENWLGPGVQSQLEGTITSLQATVETLKHRSEILEDDNARLRIRLQQHESEKGHGRGPMKNQWTDAMGDHRVC